MVAKNRLGTRSCYSLDFAQVPTKNVRGKIKRFCRQRGLECEIFSFQEAQKIMFLFFETVIICWRWSRQDRSLKIVFRSSNYILKIHTSIHEMIKREL